MEDKEAYTIYEALGGQEREKIVAAWQENREIPASEL